MKRDDGLFYKEPPEGKIVYKTVGFSFANGVERLHLVLGKAKNGISKLSRDIEQAIRDRETPEYHREAKKLCDLRKRL